MPEPLLAFSSALALTIAVEVAVATSLLSIHHCFSLPKTESKDKNSAGPFGNSTIPQLWLVIGFNLISHPIAWWAWNVLGINYWLVETAVVGFEGLVLTLGLRSLGLRLNWKQALFASICLNVASGSVGWLI